MPLTVVQLLPALDGGGVERGTLEVVRELVRCGHRALVVAAPGRLAQSVVDVGGEHLPWAVGEKSPRVLRYLFPLRRLVRERRVDILHARSRLPAWLALSVWRSLPLALRPRFVTTFHGLYSVKPYSAVMARGEAVIAISETVRDHILEHYPWVETGRIAVIPRGVDPLEYPHGYDPPPDWRVAWERAMPMLAGRFVLTLPARVSPRKGWDDFLALIGALRDRGIPVHGLLAGGADRPERLAALTQAITARRLEGHVSHLGHRADLREIMAASNLVFCLSKAPEAFGRVAIEALSLGVPVIGYDHGGIHEILTGVFPAGRIPVGDLPALVAKTVEFIMRPQTVPHRHPYSLRAMLDGTIALYESLHRSRTHGWPAYPGD